jgi:diaminopimelate epimerase
VIFYKTVSCGNDFILIDIDEYQSAADDKITKGQLAKRICSRHAGAGADGVVYYKIFPDTTAVNFEIFNRDGSEAELSGNGMAGLSALLFYLNKPGNQDHVVLNTKAGPKKNTCLQREKNKFHLKIEIGIANFQDHDFFPFLEKDKWAGQYNGITFYPVSVGNPHAVVLAEQDISKDKLGQIGQMLEGAPIFPYKTNVELVLCTGAKTVDYEKGENFRVFFYERGVGQTRSSSTGSAAVFAVLKKLHLITHTLTIPYPDERIKITEKNKIYIENYTEIVYKGVFLSLSK